MMRFRDRLAMAFGYQRITQPAKRVTMVSGKRTYEGAKGGRLFSSLSGTQTTADVELQDSLGLLRARSRQLARDTPHGRRFLNLVVTNVIGPDGIGLQNDARLASDPDEKDEAANTAVEEAWSAWTNDLNSSASGKLTFIDQQKLFARTLAMDGEVFVEKLFVPYNPAGVALRFWEADYFPEGNTTIGPGGAQIIMSVEVDPSGRPLGYHRLVDHPGARSELASAGRAIRVPAYSMIHAYLVDRSTQTRGEPWMHSVIGTIHRRHKYQEAALVAAQVGASKMGVITTPSGSEYTGDATDSQGNQVIDIEAGTWEELAEGQQFSSWDPAYPMGEYDPFIKAQDREIASGLNVSYHSLTGDLGDVNFSSIRSGTLDERDMWRMLQSFTARHFCEEVFTWWLPAALASGQVKGYRADDFQRLNRPTWHVRGWEWVDPAKDTRASIEAIQFGLSTWTAELAKRGLDVNETFRQLQREQELADSLGLEFKTKQTNTAGAQPQVEDAADANDQNGEIGDDVPLGGDHGPDGRQNGRGENHAGNVGGGVLRIPGGTVARRGPRHGNPFPQSGARSPRLVQ